MIISETLELPEVTAAMKAAALQQVQLDEMMEAIGQRLAELTGAEWGMVTSGCAAALTHATAACVAGGNPDLHVRLPDLEGFPKSDVIIPKQSRNGYDAALRAVGVRLLEPATAAEFEAALGPRTALVYIFAGPWHETGPLTYDDIYRFSKQRNVPVLVDAAAEMLTSPNVHLQRGAALVAYSGGKCLRGPQCAGLLLGRKDLVRAAWVHSAPHHGIGRGMKVGKEEAMGMLMAVEMWMKADHRAEYRQRLARMDYIANRVSRIDGIKAEVQEPRVSANHTPIPGLKISWDAVKLGITGEDVSQILYNTEPRIALMRDRGAGSETGLSLTVYRMSPGDEKIVADRLYSLLSAPPKKRKEPLKTPATDLTGEWDVKIQYASGTSNHRLYLKQEGNQVMGAHQGDFVTRDLTGTIDGSTISLHSSYAEGEHGDDLSYTFSGRVEGDAMSGPLSLGLYLGATWTARRRLFVRRASQGQGGEKSQH